MVGNKLIEKIGVKLFFLKRDIKIAKLKVDRTIRELKYKIYFSKQRHEKNSLMAEKFLGDITDYLRENPSEKLKPLNPKKEQLGILYFILESIDKHSLIHKCAKGTLGPNKKPYLFIEYEAGINPFRNKGQNLVDITNNKYSHLVLSYNIEKEFPYNFAFRGIIGKEHVGSIGFLISSKKIETSEDLEEILTKSKSKKVEEEFGVYNDGKRLIHRIKFPYRGKELEAVDNYYFVGIFDGETTKKQYWLYASKDDDKQVSVREKVGVFDLILCPSYVKKK